MKKIIVTGSLGLIGQACCLHYLQKGFSVFGIDNDMRRVFFGEKASVSSELTAMKNYPNYVHNWCDIRDSKINEIIQGADLIIHCAAQPSHDWSYQNPKLDFDINAVGTLNLLEATKTYAKDAMFIFLSTNKVYGDRPNSFDILEGDTRYYQKDGLGVSESMSIDYSTHSIFGVSKLSADLLVQEYGRNLGIKSAILRCGCLTGKNHKGAELHGFLSYLVKCIKENIPYTVYGYKGKQVRDNIHAEDVANCIDHLYMAKTSCHGEVFNVGGSFENNVSMLEAIYYFETALDKKLNYTISDKNRTGDHIWYITDMAKYRAMFPNWKPKYNYNQLMNQFL